MSELTAAEEDLRHHVHLYWKAYAFQGAASLILGLFAVAAPFAATYAAVLFFALLLMVAGIVGLVGAFTMRGAAGRSSSLIFSGLVLALGLVMLFDPFAGAVSMTILLAVFFLISAIANLAFARALRGKSGRYWLIGLAGIVNLGLALYLVFGLPETAVVAVGFFLGLSFVMSGAGMLVAALEARPRS